MKLTQIAFKPALTAALLAGLGLHTSLANAQSVELSPAETYLLNASVGSNFERVACSEAGNLAWRSAIELGALVPGIGTLTKAILGINRVAVASVCSGGSGLTMDEILNEVAILIDEKLDDKFRDNLNNKYYNLLGQYEAISGLLEKAERGELSEVELLTLLSKMETLSTLASSLEAETLTVGWAADYYPYVSQHYNAPLIRTDLDEQVKGGEINVKAMRRHRARRLTKQLSESRSAISVD